MIRTIWVLGFGLVLTAVLATRVVMAGWLRRPGVPCLCEEMARLWGRTLLRMSGVRVRLEGADAVDWDRPLVVVANHQSWFDVFSLMAYLPGRARFVGKEELVRIPIFGTAWRICGHVSVDRSDRSRAISSLDDAGRRVRDESLAVILFPEGTRSPDGRLQPFKKGAFVLAIKTGVPILPLGISGSRGVMPKGSFLIRPGEIRIRVGEPIPTGSLSTEERDQLLERTRAAVSALVGQDPLHERDLHRREDVEEGRGGGTDRPTGEPGSPIRSDHDDGEGRRR